MDAACSLVFAVLFRIGIVFITADSASALSVLSLPLLRRLKFRHKKDLVSKQQEPVEAPTTHKVPEIESSKMIIQAKSSKIVYGPDDKLFGCIERNQATTGRSFGRFLDAGTGSHSLRWIASLLLPQSQLRTDTDTQINDPSIDLSIEEYTAVTADESMRGNVLREAQSLGIEDKGSIIIGNWNVEGETNSDEGDIELCHSEMYDTILADYLVGAMDGFSPYYQDQIFPRLSKHLKPGGRIYVVGLNPIPHHTTGDANIFCKVTRLRDACILLAGHRCYREYPVNWIERHLEKAGLKVVSSSQFPIMYSHAAIVRQLNVARSKLLFFPSKALAKEMGEEIDKLEKESKELTDKSPNGRLKLGFDYVVSAEKPIEEENEV